VQNGSNAVLTFLAELKRMRKKRSGTKRNTTIKKKKKTMTAEKIGQ